mmetsp:Transcript_7775/g.26107  ORF Transcript_7775/g.26107 Transcript_7775/m.26107 type:complete len:108 (+) Transcript_7775:202-525(+)
MVVSDVHGRGSRAMCPCARGARCGRDVGGSVDRMGAVARARAAFERVCTWKACGTVSFAARVRSMETRTGASASNAMGRAKPYWLGSRGAREREPRDSFVLRSRTRH